MDGYNKQRVRNMTVMQKNQWDHLLTRYHSLTNFDQRQHLYQTFVKQSWPTRKNKRFRFVDFKGLNTVDWQWPVVQSTLDALAGYHYPENTWVYALVDGHALGWVARPEGEMKCPIDVSIEPVNTTSDAHTVMTLLGGSWSTARLFMSIKAGLVLQHPICILHHTTSSAKPTTTQWQHHLQVGEGAKAQVMMQFPGATDAQHWTNIHWQVDVDQHANLSLSSVCLPSAAHYHTHHLLLKQKAHSQCGVLIGHVDAYWGFQDVRCHLLEPGASVALKTLAAMRYDQQWSQSIQVQHRASHTHSSVQSRSRLDDRACHHLHIHGDILPKVIGARATQNHRSLLLSDYAHVRSEPMLEIANDDVSCAHGSTVSQLDSNALFYLQSRGLPYAVARAILAEAFLGSLLSDPLTQSIQCQLMEALGAMTWGNVRDN